MSKNRLNKNMDAAAIQNVLSNNLTGQNIADVAQLIDALGGRVQAEFDIANSGLEAGYQIDEGVVAGDPILGLMIGLPRGLFRSDKRVGAYLKYDESGIVTDVLSVDINPK